MNTTLALKLIDYGYISPGVEVRAKVSERDGSENYKYINVTNVRENRVIGKSVTKDQTVYQFLAEDIDQISSMYLDNFLKRHNIDENGDRIVGGRRADYRTVR